MKKSNLKNILIYLIIIIFICLLKKDHILSITIDKVSIRDILIYWSDNQIVNLIWFLPSLFGMCAIAKKSFDKIINFDMRYKNRSRYINKVLISHVIKSFIFYFLLAIIQIILIPIFIKQNIIINLDDLTIILRFVIENMFLTTFVILLTMVMKNIMYSLIITMTSVFILLIAVVNLHLIPNNIYIPFINMYLNNNELLTPFIIIILLIIIKKMYMHYDIGGIEN